MSLYEVIQLQLSIQMYPHS